MTIQNVTYSRTVQRYLSDRHRIYMPLRIQRPKTAITKRRESPLSPGTPTCSLHTYDSDNDLGIAEFVGLDLRGTSDSALHQSEEPLRTESFASLLTTQAHSEIPVHVIQEAAPRIEVVVTDSMTTQISALYESSQVDPTLNAITMLSRSIMDLVCPSLECQGDIKIVLTYSKHILNIDYLLSSSH